MCLNLRQGKHHFHSPQTKKKHQKGHLKVSTSLFVLFGLLSVWLFTCIHFQQDLYCRQSRSSLFNLPGRKTDVHPKKTPARKSTTSSNQPWHSSKVFLCTTMKFICVNFLLLKFLPYSFSDASDPVLRQYTELPYPDFSENQLHMERVHYSNEDRQVRVIIIKRKNVQSVIMKRKNV